MSFFPGDDPRLWTAEQFVATEADEIGSVFQRFDWSWLMLGYSELFCRSIRAASVTRRSISAGAMPANFNPNVMFFLTFMCG